MRRVASAWLTVVVVASALGGAAGLASPGVGAQPDTVGGELGETEYRRHCAACHGVDGKGDGPVAEFMTQKPADLTGLAKRHGGRFPTETVYRIIDGRNGLRPHGTEEMPVWGERYEAESLRGQPLPPGIDPEFVVHARILSLVYYLESIQAD